MQNWSKGVELELHGVGSYRTVKSTDDAAQCLLAHWPTGKGKAYLEAQEACLSALEGATSPELAREAFIAAALAAKIHIRSTEDPRAAAMSAGKNKMSVADSPAFRKANHDAMEAIKATVRPEPGTLVQFFKDAPPLSTRRSTRSSMARASKGAPTGAISRLPARSVSESRRHAIEAVKKRVAKFRSERKRRCIG